MKIHHVTVLGAGVMGRGIAHVAAQAGFETRLFDVSGSQVEGALGAIGAELERGIARGKVSFEEKARTLAHLKGGSDFTEAVAGADIVIEAVPERIELKLEIFQRLEHEAPPHAILASNTSSLSLTEMASVVSRPGRVIGMHFFNPVHKMKLVEIIRALDTDDATYEATATLARALGKETVLVNESPGFVTSRINVLIGNEAFYMLQEGVASARDIDKAIKLGLNHPMGPFEMGDLVGLDTRLATLRHLQRTLGEKYRPCPLLEKYVKAGRLGKKVGRGVYDYEDEEPRS